MKKGISTILIIGLTVAVMLAIFAAIYYVFLQPKPIGKDTLANQSDQKSAKTGEPASPYLIYAETISEVNNSDRSWPTKNIYRTSNGTSKEFLVTVGKVGEFPGRFFLSPDKNSLYINLESKLQVLNLSTKQLSDVLNAEYSIGTLVFSSDGQSMMVWDQKYASSDKHYALHRVNLSTKQDTIVKTGILEDDPDYLEPYSWRDDSKIAMIEPLGEAVKYWYFDLEDLSIKQAHIGDVGFGYAEGQLGKLLAVPTTTIANICNEMSGLSPNGYEIIDNISGSKTAGFSVPGVEVNLVGFSADDKDLLYYTSPLATNDDECLATRAKSYYKYNIASDTSVPVADFPTLLSEWQIDKIGADFSNSLDGKANNILLDGKVAITSEKYLEIIAEYWK